MTEKAPSTPMKINVDYFFTICFFDDLLQQHHQNLEYRVGTIYVRGEDENRYTV